MPSAPVVAKPSVRSSAAVVTKTLAPATGAPLTESVTTPPTVPSASTPWPRQRSASLVSVSGPTDQ